MPSQIETATSIEMELEVVRIPVSDVDVAKAFYTEKVGFHLDDDVRAGNGMRVQDIDAAREALAGRGVPVGDVQQLGPEGSVGSRYVFFEDPDGNVWSVQEIKRP